MVVNIINQSVWPTSTVDDILLEDVSDDVAGRRLDADLVGEGAGAGAPRAARAALELPSHSDHLLQQGSVFTSVYYSPEL